MHRCSIQKICGNLRNRSPQRPNSRPSVCATQRSEMTSRMLYNHCHLLTKVTQRQSTVGMCVCQPHRVDESLAYNALSNHWDWSRRTTQSDNIQTSNMQYICQWETIRMHLSEHSVGAPRHVTRRTSSTEMHAFSHSAEPETQPLWYSDVSAKRSNASICKFHCPHNLSNSCTL